MIRAFHTRYYAIQILLVKCDQDLELWLKRSLTILSASPSCIKNVLNTCFLSQIYWVFGNAHQNHARVRLVSHITEQPHRDSLGERLL